MNKIKLCEKGKALFRQYVSYSEWNDYPQLYRLVTKWNDHQQTCTICSPHTFPDENVLEAYKNETRNQE